ncbi:hypothetical protein EV677_0810 [Herminiimonas fonticola]|uniref:Uncharacterized protein n=1 Tax=Herminiimonas fonticola TaxID=303380 RepID=A0A4R6GHF3_9BURK|nr:hypothetical protein Hfont_0785 [Herminiimonas fonticola]TDN94267.1 hypothetical protein EV677_0810 [Herminiimonas fonticola]
MVQIIYGRIQNKKEKSIFWTSTCEKSHAFADQMRFEFEAIERNKAFAVFPL